MLDSRHSLWSMERTTVGAEIVKVLSPYLGATMAEASTRTHCEKLGIVGQAMSTEQTDALIGKLASGLAVFVGREKAAGVVQEIRKALAAPGMPS